nr:hypothetical protein [Tanacetum cinerariifolium]
MNLAVEYDNACRAKDDLRKAYEKCNDISQEIPNYGSQTHMGGSSIVTVEESVEEHDIADEYLTDGYLTQKEQHQLLLDEEALRETLEKHARAKKRAG